MTYGIKEKENYNKEHNFINWISFTYHVILIQEKKKKQYFEDVVF